jgi:CRP/FNR family transcriptional regulator, cyclic AMP receptor protein
MPKIDQGDLILGLPHLFVKKFMDITVKKSYETGQSVFLEGDNASYFYTLIQGSVKLSIGETGEEVYIVEQAGEVFGWSSLMDRSHYSASAECVEPTNLLLVEKEKLERLLNNDPVNGLIFYKNLSQTLGNRLLKSYKIISEAKRLEEQY